MATQLNISLGDVSRMELPAITLARRELNQHGHRYTWEFRDWLRENWRIWCAFYSRARAAQAFRDHYGAKAIVEVIRYESTLAESDGEFKINNNWAPQLARLYNNCTRSEFFQVRESRADLPAGDPQPIHGGDS